MRPNEFAHGIEGVAAVSQFAVEVTMHIPIGCKSRVQQYLKSLPLGPVHQTDQVCAVDVRVEGRRDIAEPEKVESQGLLLGQHGLPFGEGIRIGMIPPEVSRNQGRTVGGRGVCAYQGSQAQTQSHRGVVQKLSAV